MNEFLQMQLLQSLPMSLSLGWAVALIPLLPLAVFVILGLFGRKYFRNSSGLIATFALFLSTIVALYIAYGYFFEYGKLNGVYQKIVPLQLTWLQFSPGRSIDMGILLDPISVMMLVVVTFISLMVHLYSLSYMKGAGWLCISLCIMALNSDIDSTFCSRCMRSSSCPMELSSDSGVMFLRNAL